MGKHFGTDGVRGVAGTELTPQLAFRLGQAGAAVLGREHKRPVFVVGRDTRISGDMLEAALTAGILSAGGDVISAGIIPTPCGRISCPPLRGFSRSGDFRVSQPF